MNGETLKQFKAHAIAEFPREACGLVAVVRGRERFIPCRNAASTPSEHFVISAEDYSAAEDAGEIIGIAHTHPNWSAQPSEADKVSCEHTGLPWYILSVFKDEAGKTMTGDLVTLAPSGYEAPLVGREFAHGVLDCYTLIRDWYKRERGIELLDWDRNDDWWNKGENLYFDHYAETGFSPIKGEMKVGDVIIMQIRSPVPNHAAIYLGDGNMLHHLYGRLSSRDMYGGYWQEVTRAVIRHKDLMND